jgi:hypothetical protein
MFLEVPRDYYLIADRTIESKLKNILISNNAQSFCQSYCPAKPVTITTTKVKTTTASKTIFLYPSTYVITKTIRGAQPPAVVLTATSITTTTGASTVEAPTSTITTFTTEPPIVQRTTTVTTTSTLTFAGITLDKRGNRLPGYLRGYTDAEVSNACREFLELKTKTVTRYSTATSTILVAKTKYRAVVVTTRTTVTPLASTTTTTELITSTTVQLFTSTPVIVVTITIPGSTTLVTTTTVTQPVCPGATDGITGISVKLPGTLSFPNAPTAEQCCTACFTTPGCVAWWSVKDSICAYVVNAPPNLGAPTDICPFGLGDWLFSIGGPTDGTQVGGKGQCAGTQQ